jgi:hypothetical protein
LSLSHATIIAYQSKLHRNLLSAASRDGYVATLILCILLLNDRVNSNKCHESIRPYMKNNIGAFWSLLCLEQPGILLTSR